MQFSESSAAWIFLRGLVDGYAVGCADCAWMGRVVGAWACTLRGGRTAATSGDAEKISDESAIGWPEIAGGGRRRRVREQAVLSGAESRSLQANAAPGQAEERTQLEEGGEGHPHLLYYGSARITVRGPVSGRLYEFTRQQPRQTVDPRDAVSMLKTRLFRRIR